MRSVFALLLPAVLTACVLAGCGSSSDGAGYAGGSVLTPGSTADASAYESQAPTAPSSGLETPDAPPEPVSSGKAPNDQAPESELKQAAKDVMDMLRGRDLQSLQAVIDPEKGLRFSPYAHLDDKSGKVFQAAELPSFKDTAKLNWGAYDGSGEPIELTFRDYFEKFVYDQDFASAPDVSVNKLAGTGNVKFNGKDLYPDASYVEYHFPGFDRKNEGMDWESLVLMFRPSGGEWKLCAIVHGQWAI